MAAERLDRKLSAILAADVAGYSRLMGADEEATLAALNGHLRQLLDPAITAHRGRVFKRTGDGLLAAFASVVDAVRCAVEVQAGMAERNAGVPDDRRLVFRLGINVGDIVEQDGDIFGDGVNIAARLEGIAEPGGICVSARVQEDAVGKVDIAFEDIGEQTLKNIDRPIHVYRVHPGLSGRTPAASTLPEHAGLPDRPSLAVLPFQNMSGDVEQDYFADGIVEDIITALSRFRSFAVIARNSSFVYKGRPVDVRQVAKDLGVRYVLQGSVRRAGRRLRITAQLVDGASGAHLWARNFDGELEGVFDVQDRITESVVGVVEPHIRQAEIERSARKRPDSLDAYDFYLRALAHFYKAGEPSNAAAYAYLARALELEPEHAPFLAAAAQVLEARVALSLPTLTGDDRAKCLEFVQRALANNQGDAEVLARCGIALIRFGPDYDRGLRLLANAVETNPNNQLAQMLAGIGELHCGSLDKAIAHSERAILLTSSGDPTLPLPVATIAHAHLAAGRYEQAIVEAERAQTLNAGLPFPYWILVAGHAHLGRMTEAHSWLARLVEVAPQTSVARISAGQPGKDPSRMAPILDGLRLAGLPES